MSYAPRWTVSTRALDGFDYRAVVSEWNYAGSTTPIKGRLDGEGPLVLEHGRPGPPDLAEPLPGSRCRIRLAASDAELGTLATALVGAASATFEVCIERTDPGDADWSVATTIWRGVLLQESAAHFAYAVENGRVDEMDLVAVDGFDLLAGIAPVDADTTEVLATVLRCVSSLNPGALASGGQASGLSGLARLYALQEWVPWLPSQVVSTFDAMRMEYNLYTYEREDGVVSPGGQGYESQLTILQQVLDRFNLRLFQSEGNWYAMQRGGVAGALGVPTVWSYDTAGGLTSGFPQALDLVYDDAGKVYRADADRAPRRTLTVPVTEARVAYQWKPSDLLEKLVRNGSFEEGSGTNADEWSQGAHCERKQIADVFLAGQYTATFENTHCLTATALSASSVAAEQNDLFFVPRGGDTLETCHVLNVSALCHLLLRSAPIEVTRGGRVRLSVTDAGTTYYLVPFSVTVASDVLDGDDVELPVQPLFSDSLTGTEGVVILPAGSVLRFHDETDETATRKELTLSRAARIGDTAIFGRLSSSVSQGDTATAHYWRTTPGYLGIPELDNFAAMYSFAASAPLLLPQGTAFGGTVSVRLEGPVRGGPSATAFSVFDAVQIGLQRGAGANGAIVRANNEAAYLASEGGVAYDVGTLAIGDGPTTEGLVDPKDVRFSGLSFALQPTYQGVNTGWKVGRYGSGEATTGVGLDALHVRELVKQTGQALERRLMTLVLRDQDTYAPHRVMKHRDGKSDVDGFKLYTCDYLRHDLYRGEVQGEWTQLAILGKSITAARSFGGSATDAPGAGGSTTSISVVSVKDGGVYYLDPASLVSGGSKSSAERTANTNAVQAFINLCATDRVEGRLPPGHWNVNDLYLSYDAVNNLGFPSDPDEEAGRFVLRGTAADLYTNYDEDFPDASNYQGTVLDFADGTGLTLVGLDAAGTSARASQLTLADMMLHGNVDAGSDGLGALLIISGAVQGSEFDRLFVVNRSTTGHCIRAFNQFFAEWRRSVAYFPTDESTGRGFWFANPDTGGGLISAFHCSVRGSRRNTTSLATGFFLGSGPNDGITSTRKTNVTVLRECETQFCYDGLTVGRQVLNWVAQDCFWEFNTYRNVYAMGNPRNGRILGGYCLGNNLGDSTATGGATDACFVQHGDTSLTGTDAFGGSLLILGTEFNSISDGIPGIKSQDTRFPLTVDACELVGLFSDSSGRVFVDLSANSGANDLVRLGPTTMATNVDAWYDGGLDGRAPQQGPATATVGSAFRMLAEDGLVDRALVVERDPGTFVAASASGVLALPKGARFVRLSGTNPLTEIDTSAWGLPSGTEIEFYTSGARTFEHDSAVTHVPLFLKERADAAVPNADIRRFVYINDGTLTERFYEVGTRTAAIAGAHIADAETAHALGMLYTNTEVEAALDALGTTLNAVLARLEAAGLSLTS